MRTFLLAITLLLAGLAHGQDGGFFLLNQQAVNDPDAADYITRVEATGATLTQAEKDALHVFVSELKANSLWAKVYEAGPMFGGTSAACAVNLKGVTTTTWMNSPIFTSTGVTGNGTNQYGKTGAIPSVFATSASGHLSYYSRTANTNNEIDIGAVTSTTYYMELRAYWAGAATAYGYTTTAAVGAPLIPRVLSCKTNPPQAL